MRLRIAAAEYAMTPAIGSESDPRRRMMKSARISSNVIVGSPPRDQEYPVTDPLARFDELIRRLLTAVADAGELEPRFRRCFDEATRTRSSQLHRFEGDSIVAPVRA